MYICTQTYIIYSVKVLQCCLKYVIKYADIVIVNDNNVGNVFDVNELALLQFSDEQVKTQLLYSLSPVGCLTYLQ